MVLIRSGGLEENLNINKRGDVYLAPESNNLNNSIWVRPCDVSHRGSLSQFKITFCIIFIVTVFRESVSCFDHCLIFCFFFIHINVNITIHTYKQYKDYTVVEQKTMTTQWPVHIKITLHYINIFK